MVTLSHIAQLNANGSIDQTPPAPTAGWRWKCCTCAFLILHSAFLLCIHCPLLPSCSRILSEYRCDPVQPLGTHNLLLVRQALPVTYSLRVV